MIATANNINFLQPVNYLCSLSRGLTHFGLPGIGFDGGSVFYDLTRHNNNGVMQNGAGWGGPISPLGFGSTTHDGVNDHIDLTAYSVPRGSTQCIWFKADTVGTSDDQPNLLHTGTHYVGIDGANNQLQFFSGGFRNSTGVITVGKWHFAVYSGGLTGVVGNSKMYLDGVKVFDASFNMGGPSGGTEIGARNDLLSNPYTLDGNIGGVLLYERILSESEVWELYIESLHGYPNLLNQVSSPRQAVAPALIVDSFVNTRSKTVMRNTLIRM